MKKILKQILTFSLIFIMVLSAVPVQAGVPEYFGGKKTVTLYTGRTVKNPAVNYFFTNPWIGFFEKAGENVTSIRSSNPSVAEASFDYSSINVTPKKAGKTVITAKGGNKIRKCNLTVRKYTNPVVSVKIGNTSISGKRFDKEAYRVIPYSKFAKKKVKVTFNLKKGWYMKKQGLSYMEKSWFKSEDVDNGSTIPINGRDFKICVDVVNEKTGQQERILLWFK